MTEEQVLRVHCDHFGKEGRAFHAPARVNLIGEHTDYSGGFVMPMAIGFQTIAAISARDDDQIHIVSENFEEAVSRELQQITATDPMPRGHWSDYPMGVVWALSQHGIKVPGFSMTIDGDVPLGAGLSSSASIEVATAMAILALTRQTLSLEQVAVLCRRAENEYVGAKSGIMDQFVVTGGVAGRAMMLDCRSLAYELLPLPATVRVVICNSMVQHAVAGGEYGNRRDELMEGQAVLVRECPGVLSLRDATLDDLERCRDLMDPRSFRRCRHVITENARVLRSRDALLRGDVGSFGQLMAEAHRSFRDDFEASCEEVDTLVEIASRQPECYGARITGGGFGGCTVNLVGSDHVDHFVGAVKNAYQNATAILPDCFVCEPSDGALAMLHHGA